VDEFQGHLDEDAMKGLAVGKLQRVRKRGLYLLRSSRNYETNSTGSSKNAPRQLCKAHLINEVSTNAGLDLSRSITGTSLEIIPNEVMSLREIVRVKKRELKVREAGLAADGNTVAAVLESGMNTCQPAASAPALGYVSLSRIPPAFDSGGDLR